ncbi:ABC transporter permease [Nibricoccus sp. IMCC34717]|uniref:ABC transporter permease n=1 Tax=Nibricoccus sp. IMCC34717 TaxID=3034021 RepID=UPI00384A8593
MNPTEIIRLALSSLAANKLRSVLTVLGISIGIFSVIGVMTFINGARSSFESGLSRLGANSFQIQKFPAINFSNPWLRYGNRRDITLPMAERFKTLMSEDIRVNVQIRQRGLVATHGDFHTNPDTAMTGTDENFLPAFNYEIAKGRGLGAEDVALGRAVCVVGHDVVQKIFPGEDPMGKLVRVGGQNYEVIGVLAQKGTSLGESQDNLILMPITRWLAVMGRQGRSISINIQSPDAASLPAIQDKAVGAMRLVRGLEPEDPNDFEVFSNDTLIETFNNIMGLIAMASLAISTVALVGAGVGVMNIMLVSVTERTKEIGIRKSLGARQVNILTQFLVEAVVLALIGGLIGVAIGVAGGNLVANMMNADLVFPWGWAAGGMAVCGGIGVIFGFYPAWKAARLDPIEALRYE